MSLLFIDKKYLKNKEEILCFNINASPLEIIEKKYKNKCGINLMIRGKESRVYI